MLARTGTMRVALKGHPHCALKRITRLALKGQACYALGVFVCGPKGPHTNTPLRHDLHMALKGHVQIVPVRRTLHGP